MAAPNVSADWRKLYSKCESPIEQELCAAFIATEQTIIPFVTKYVWEEVEECGSMVDGPVAFLWAQESILRFRVDFLVARYNSRTGFFRRLAVECDGHGYHGSIRQQKIDNIRDRKIRPHVGGIVRVSGTEIKRDALAEAWKILWLLEFEDDHRVTFLPVRGYTRLNLANSAS